MAAQRTYLAIDLKSFYASVECVDRHLDPLTTNLVVADASRTEKTICLAVSPSLKAYKIPGRARLFEAVQRVKEVNAQRLQTAIRQKKAVRGEDGKYHFASTSFDANALNADPALGLSYIVAPPRMQRYLDVSTQIYKTYLKYVSPADIYPYSIDEVFIDVTGYLPYYHMSAHELAMTMVREVLYNTGITATAGIGTNLYLAKLAMDIVAKHIPADKDGVRIAELDEQSYRYLLWNHRPLTDFWMTGPGTVKRLELASLNTARKAGIRALTLSEGDELIAVMKTDGKQDILLASANGMVICFNENDVRVMGRDAAGVRGMMLDAGDYVVGAGIAAKAKQLLSVTEYGYGKRTEIEAYLRLGEDGQRRPQNRGGKGLKGYNITAKTGRIAGVAIVDDADDIMLIENGGVLIRMAAADINIYGRDTQGVILMRLEAGSRVISVDRVDREPEEPAENQNPEPEISTPDGNDFV